MSERRENVIGHTVLGRPIEAVMFTPPTYAKPRPPALLFAAIHGDEPVSQLMLERLADELVERPPGRETWILPCVNVDGILAGTRNNANDVDLNRNFASVDWGTQRRPGYNQRFVAVHATYRMVNWDGCAEQLARDMAERCGYPAEPSIGYPTPGSFGAKYGVDRGLEVITLESPYITVDEAAWLECRAALRWCVDLPD
jgi:murein peptide amidase A